MLATFPPQMSYRIGPIIRSIRGTHKQEYCASLVGCSRRQWIRWEKNQSFPSYPSIVAIESIFKVTLMAHSVTHS